MKSLESEPQHFFHTYKRAPIDIDHGEGLYLFTKDGKRFLDLFAGLAVNALGYGHPKIISAIEEQCKRFIHLSNYYVAESQTRLAELLLHASGYQKVFFTNSGTEAMEGTIKLARKWGLRSDKTEIISFTNSFHGRTLGALSLMDNEKYRHGFGPFLDHCSIIKFNESCVLEQAINAHTAAIVLEFIQGEGGIVPASKEFIDRIRMLRDKYNFLVIADEIQSGLGRTGKLFGFQHYDIRPDVVLVAKPLGGGLPLGAILGNERVQDVFEPGDHGTTFGGNPVACAAGVAMLNEIIYGGVMDNAAKMGAILYGSLRTLQQTFPKFIVDIRGLGLMIGMELSVNCNVVITDMRERGILLNCTRGNVVRFLPPLIIHREAIGETINALTEIFSAAAG